VRIYIGNFEGQDIYLNTDIPAEAAILGLIRHQQDEIEALRTVLTIDSTMQRLIDKEDG